MDGNTNHFPAKMHQIAGSCIYNLKIFPGAIPPDPQRSVPGPRHQFLLGSPAFPLFLFNETTTGTDVTRTRLFYFFFDVLCCCYLGRWSNPHVKWELNLPPPPKIFFVPFSPSLSRHFATSAPLSLKLLSSLSSYYVFLHKYPSKRSFKHRIHSFLFWPLHATLNFVHCKQ